MDSNLWAIENGDPVGITTYFLDKGLDTGDIIEFFQLDINAIGNLIDYFKVIHQLKKEAIYKTILAINDKKVTPLKQENKELPPHGPMALSELYEVQDILY